MIQSMDPQEYTQVHEVHEGADLFDRFARHYDGDYRDCDDDIDLILDLASECDGPILELGCGTGRVMKPLVAAGHNVVGIDISPKLLKVAAEKLAGQQTDGRFELVESELTIYDLPARNFGLAVCTSNTLMHLTTAERQMAVLENAFRHLASGGWLFLDLFNPDVARLVAVNGIVELADEWEDSERGLHVVKWSVRSVDFAEQLQDTLFIYEETGEDGLVKRTVCPFLLRYLWRSEAELMLQQSGFAVEAVWGDFVGGPYVAESERLTLLAKKTIAAN